MKRFIYYFLWTIILITILNLAAKFQIDIKNQTAITYNSTPLYVYSTFYPIVIGLLIKLPLFIENFNKTIWSLDWGKLIGIGLPSFYIATLPLIAAVLSPPNLFLFNVIIMIGPSVPFIASIIFGFYLLDSLRK